jgi:hypothetical protein
MLLNYDNYNIINKSRHQNKNGAGGIAILLKKNINSIQIVDNAFNELEIIVINIFIKNQTLTLVSYYNAPHLNLNIRILEQLNNKYQNLIILEDLNSKAMSLGCKSKNANGILLEELIINSKLLIANNKDHTYFRTHDNSSDILDWCIISNNLHQNFVKFEVLNNNLVESDHIPLRIEMNFEQI